MKTQVKTTADDLRQEFNKQFGAVAAKNKTSGLDQLLTTLSTGIADLQDIDIDVKVKLRPDGHANAYDLIYTVHWKGPANAEIGAYGFIEIGNASHLIALCTQHADKHVLRVYMSSYNMTDQGSPRKKIDNGDAAPGAGNRAYIPGHCYDFGEDDRALGKLQKRIMLIAAGNNFLAQNDPEGVFNTGSGIAGGLKKPGLKSPGRL